jgi:hypothetical protein
MDNHTITSVRKQHVVVTGYLWERHAQVPGRIRRAGGYVQDEVSASTDLLVRGMPNPQSPRKPNHDTPDYDLAWYQPDGRFVVAEVKSLIRANEAQQIRLGLATSP